MSMTREEIEARAALIMRTMIEQAEHTGKKIVGTLYPLPLYATADDYRAICSPRGEYGMTFDEWTAMTYALLERLRDAGAIVELVEVRALQFFAWITAQGLPNTLATRHTYAASQSTPGKALMQRDEP